MPYRTIDPEEAEMMIVIRRFEKSLASERRYPTGAEIAAAMEIDIERIRTLVSSVNSGELKYVCSVRLKKKTSGTSPSRGAPPATYHLAEMTMVGYPSTGFFLVTAIQFEKDENVLVNERSFLDHMVREHRFTPVDLQNHLEWCALKHYINRFPAKKPTTFQLTSRTYAEIAWLEALASEYGVNRRSGA